MTRELLQQAVDALTDAKPFVEAHKNGWISTGLAIKANLWLARLSAIESALQQQPEPVAALSDAQAEALIEASDGHWKEDIFCIGGPELMALLRSAASEQHPSRVGAEGWRRLAEIQAAALQQQEGKGEAVSDEQLLALATRVGLLVDMGDGLYGPLPSGRAKVLRFGREVLAVSASTAVQQEAGSVTQGGTKVYCCYGMYADMGHDRDCKFAAAPTQQPPSGSDGGKENAQ